MIDTSTPISKVTYNNIQIPLASDAEIALLEGELSGTYAIPNGVTKLGDRALYNQKNITKLIIPNSVSSIESTYSCGYLSGLTELVYDASIGVTSLSSEAVPFYYCGAEGSDFIIGPNTDCIPQYLLAVNNTAAKPKFARIYNQPRDKALTIGGFQSNTSTSTTYSNSRLKKIWLDTPSTIDIRKSAFNYFGAITKVYLNASRILNATGACFGSNGTSSSGAVFKFGESVAYIGNNVLYGVIANNVFVDKNVTQIGSSGLSLNSSGEGYITINCQVPPTIQSNTINTLVSKPIFIPKGTLEAYQSATYWSSLSSRFVELEYTNYSDGINNLTLGNNKWFDLTVDGISYNGTYVLSEDTISLEVFDLHDDSIFTGTLIGDQVTININGAEYNLMLQN